jgi:hypothetical protein
MAGGWHTRAPVRPTPRNANQTRPPENHRHATVGCRAQEVRDTLRQGPQVVLRRLCRSVRKAARARLRLNRRGRLLAGIELASSRDRRVVPRLLLLRRPPLLRLLLRRPCVASVRHHRLGRWQLLLLAHVCAPAHSTALSCAPVREGNQRGIMLMFFSRSAKCSAPRRRVTLTERALYVYYEPACACPSARNSFGAGVFTHMMERATSFRASFHKVESGLVGVEVHTEV